MANALGEALAPFILVYLAIGIIIPALLGFFGGILGTLIYFKVKKKKFTKGVGIGILIGLVLAVIFPIIASQTYIKLGMKKSREHYRTEQKNKHNKKAESLEKYKIISAGFENGEFFVNASVPRNGEYIVNVLVYSEQEYAARMHKSEAYLTEGTNRITTASEPDFINTGPPYDFYVKIWTSEEQYGYKGENKSFVSVYEGAAYYSPPIADWQDPCYFDSHVVCEPLELLHVE